MAWASWYYVSLIETVKTFPMKVKANSEAEALDIFRDMLTDGAAPDEEERTTQYIVNKKVKSF
jgi:pentatricopeptide repeat protein